MVCTCFFFFFLGGARWRRPVCKLCLTPPPPIPNHHIWSALPHTHTLGVFPQWGTHSASNAARRLASRWKGLFDLRWGWGGGDFPSFHAALAAEKCRVKRSGTYNSGSHCISVCSFFFSLFWFEKPAMNLHTAVSQSLVAAPFFFLLPSFANNRVIKVIHVDSPATFRLIIKKKTTKKQQPRMK